MENIYSTDLLLNMLDSKHDLYLTLYIFPRDQHKSFLKSFHTFTQVSKDQYKLRVNI